MDFIYIGLVITAIFRTPGYGLRCYQCSHRTFIGNSSTTFDYYSGYYSGYGYGGLGSFGSYNLPFYDVNDTDFHETSVVSNPFQIPDRSLSPQILPIDSISCVSSTIDVLFLLECNAGVTTCTTSITEGNGEAGNFTTVSRGCGIPGFPPLEDSCTHFGITSCQGSCNTDGCNTETIETYESNAIINGGKVKCYVCTHDADFPNNDCEGPSIPRQYLRTCPPDYNYCGTLTKTSDEQPFTVERGCSRLLQAHNCINNSGTEECRSSCNSEGCNYWKLGLDVTNTDKPPRCHHCSYSTLRKTGSRSCLNLDTSFVRECPANQQYCITIINTGEHKGEQQVSVQRGCSPGPLERKCSISRDRLGISVETCAITCRTEDGCNNRKTNIGTGGNSVRAAVSPSSIFVAFAAVLLVLL